MQTVIDERHRFCTLDGLRGIGAMIIVIGHATEGTFYSSYAAVDLFFMHSGFVLAHSYLSRWDRPGFVLDFAVRRMIRLYPLYAAGAVLGIVSSGLLLFVGAPGWTAHQLAWGSVLAVAMLPYFGESGFGVFPINEPAWSLFFEFFINLLVAVTGFSKRPAILLCAISAPLLVWAYSAWIDGGGSDRETFIGGFPRVGFSFFAGVLLYRLWISGKCPELRVWPWLLPVALPFIYMPDFGTSSLYIATLVFIVQPLIIWIGASSPFHGRVMPWLCGWLGLTSYALYIIHVPIMMMVEAIVRPLLRVGWDDAPPLAVLLITFPVAVVLAHVLTMYFDIPVRTALNARWKRWRAQHPPVALPAPVPAIGAVAHDRGPE